MNSHSFYVSKPKSIIIRASDVWVSELGGYEMIIFTEHQICARNFPDTLNVGDIIVPSLQKRTLRN